MLQNSLFLPLLLSLGLAAGSARTEISDATQLLDLSAGSSRSSSARQLGIGGYELSDGTPVSFRDWYRPQSLPELTLLLLTQVSENVGIIWGLSTGEHGRKYRISPAVQLGLVAQTEVFEGATLSLNLTTTIGGDLKEKPCQADYGAFGSSAVNCRLAATEIPPEETLDYLLDLPGSRSTSVTIRFDYRF